MNGVFDPGVSAWYPRLMRLAKRVGPALLLVLVAGSARAQTPSIIGGKLLPSGTTGHHFGVGLPTFFYEWWNAAAAFDWGLHVGMVYDDWSAEFSDMDVGLSLEAPMRFLLAHRGAADVSFRFSPGLLVGDLDRGPFDRRGDDLVIGLRPEMGVLVTIELGGRANLATGGVVPFTLLIRDTDAGNDLSVVIPLLPRIGLEIQAVESLIPWFLVELGPTIGIDDGGRDAELGARGWVGVTWYP